MITLGSAMLSAIELVIYDLIEQLDAIPEDDPGRRRISEALQRLEEALLSVGT